MSSTRDEPTECDFDECIVDDEVTIVKVGRRVIRIPNDKVLEIDHARMVITVPEYIAVARDLV